MVLISFLIFLVAQIAMMFAFYHFVIRPLPEQINDLLFKQHLKNDFTHVATDTAELVRTKLLELEAERLEAVCSYEAVKGKQKLSITQRNSRDGLKKAVDQLGRQIDALRKQLDVLYASPVLSHLRQFEELRLVAALNARLDQIAKTGRRH